MKGLRAHVLTCNSDDNMWAGRVGAFERVWIKYVSNLIEYITELGKSVCWAKSGHVFLQFYSGKNRARGLREASVDHLRPTIF